MRKLMTDRSELRDLDMKYVNDFYDYCKEPSVGPMAGWKPHESIDESKRIMQMIINSNEVWGIYIGDCLVGTVGLHVKESGNTRDLGYVLSRKYWGKGIIVEVCNEIIKHAFDIMKLDTINVSHFKKNYQSKRVIEKLGFTYFGEVIGSLTNRATGELEDSLKYIMVSPYNK